MAEDLGERTEDATPKRLEDARKEGNIAKSVDASSAIVLLALTIALSIALPSIMTACGALLRATLEPIDNAHAVRLDSLDDVVSPSLYSLGALLFPMLLVAAVVAYAAHVWQVGFHASGKSLMPKAERISPLSGLKRLFGTQTLVKTIFDLTKVAIVVAIVAVAVTGFAPTILALPGADAVDGSLAIGRMAYDVAIRIAAVLLVLGLADFAWQRFKHKRDLRMTKQEVKDEYKQMEGDPEIKRRRMQIQRQIAMQRIGAAVPKADVIVTNPEHISVAIAYDADSMRAPKVVAKGADHLAMRIRAIAKQHGVPIVERKPLARALYAQVKVGQEVPPDFYKAVAEILAYVYRLDQSAARRAAKLRPSAAAAR
jgi:flagellar biosynthetic protein FlhB